MVFLVSIDRKNPFNISVEGLQFIISTFSCLILKLKSPSGTSFGLYFAFAEYRTDDSSSPAEWNVSPPASTDKMKTCSSGKDWNSLRHTGEKCIVSSNICIFCLQICLFCYKYEFVGKIYVHLEQIYLFFYQIYVFVGKIYIYLYVQEKFTHFSAFNNIRLPNPMYE